MTHGANHENREWAEAPAGQGVKAVRSIVNAEVGLGRTSLTFREAAAQLRAQEALLERAAGVRIPTRAVGEPWDRFRDRVMDAVRKAEREDDGYGMGC